MGDIVCLGTPFIDMPQFDFIWIGETGREELRSHLFTVGAALGAAATAVVLFARVPEVAGNGQIVGELFREIVGDPLLVHSAYYRSRENCGRIARFIARRE